MSHKVADDLGISDDLIAKRAYELWQARGCPEGDSGNDWETARQQLIDEVRQPRAFRPIRNFFARLRNRAAI